MNQPTISVNKLAEYIVSRAARQRKILHDRKYPDPDFAMGAYYREAEECIQQYLNDGADDQSPLEMRLRVLNQASPEKIGTIRRINSNIAGIERFQTMLDDIDLKGMFATMGKHSAAKITIRNVAISVRPEIVLRGQNAKKKNVVGAMKLHLSTADKFTEEAAGFVSAITQEYLRQHVLEDGEIVFPEMCQCVDVGNGEVWPGVKATAQRMKDVEANCQNIFDLWPSI